MEKLWQTLSEVTIAGNAMWRIVSLFGVVLVALLAGRLMKSGLDKVAERLTGQEKRLRAAFVASFGRSVIYVFFVVGLSQALKILILAEKIRVFTDTVMSVLIITSIGYVAYVLVDVIDEWLQSLAVKSRSKMDDMLVPMVRTSMRITIVVLVVIQIAQTLSGKPLTSILAGLGVGGLAVALAAQDTIKNFFGSLVIFADKPFELGDRIVVDGHDGPVEEVGFRSTRIRTLDGHLITVPNGELANKTIQNIGKRPFIKRVAQITITYDTRPDKVDRAVEIIKDILDDHEGMHPDFPPRVYFTDFNDCSLGILVIYWYHPPDYWAYCAFNEKVNMQILQRFNDEGIDFAFPTQTLYLAGDQTRPLNVTAQVDKGGVT